MGIEFSKIEAIIFDFDDTLVDEEKWVRGRWEKTIQYAETELQIEKFGNAFWKIYRKRGWRYKKHVNEALQMCGKEDNQAGVIVDHFLNQTVDESPFQGVFEFLNYIKDDFKLGIVTNGREDVQQDRIERTGISKYFSSVICAFDNPKPDPEPYLSIVHDLGVLPENSIYVSHEQDDFDGAKRIGMSTVHVNFSSENGMKNVDQEVSDYFDFLRLIKEEMSDREGVLIVGGGILQIPAILKAREMGLRSIVTDGDEKCPSAEIADEFYKISTKDIEGHVDLAVRLTDEGRISAVYTQGCDVEYTVAMAAKAAGLPGIDPEIALNCNDKARMREIINEKGVDRVEFSAVSNLKDCINASLDIGFPCVIKPLDNSASRGVSVVREEDELEAAFNLAIGCCFIRNEVIIEEFLEGDEFSVDTVIWDGKVFPAGISDREFVPKESYSVQTGSLTPSKLPEEIQEKMYNLMESAADALGVTSGAFKGDLVLVGGEPRIIEVTARTSGGFDSQYRKPYSFGIDIIKATLDISLGRVMDPLDLVPRWCKWSKTTSVFPDPGIVSKISGIDILERTDGVRKIFCLIEHGDEIETYTDCSKRTNFVIISADTYDELVELEEFVWRTLIIETVEKL